jgi:hypothetical protein
MKSAVVVLVIAAVLLGVPAQQASAAHTCKPVVGHFEARVVPSTEGCTAALCTTGRVWGGIQGRYDFVVTALEPSAPHGGWPSVVFFTGESTIHLKSGDELLGTDTGSIDLPPSGLGGFASLITFHGGTGAMTDATGQIRLRGELDDTGTTSGDYIGTLCTQ